MNGNTNAKNTPVAVLNKVVVVVPDFRQWSGTRAMHEGDFVVGRDGKLPPKEVTKSLGLKAVIDPVALRVFGRIKHQAEAVLEGCGVRFLSGWAVPEGKADAVFAELDAIIGRYNDEKSAFLKQYDSLVSDWAARNPGFSREILEGKLDCAAVAEKIAAGYEAFRLQPVTEAGAQALANRVGGLAGELITDIAQIARTFFKESFLGKNRANRKTVNAVLKLRERLDGLAFLSSSIQPLIDMIDGVVAQVPAEGYFEGEAYWQLATLVQTLGNENLLEEIIRKQVSAEALQQAAAPESTPEETDRESVRQQCHDNSPEQEQGECQQAAVVQELQEKSSDALPETFENMEAFFGVDKTDEESPVLFEDEEIPPTQATTKSVVAQDDGESPICETQEHSYVPEDDGRASSDSWTGTAAAAIPPDVDIGDGMFF